MDLTKRSTCVKSTETIWFWHEAAEKTVHEICGTIHKQPHAFWRSVLSLAFGTMFLTLIYKVFDIRVI